MSDFSFKLILMPVALSVVKFVFAKGLVVLFQKIYEKIIINSVTC